MPNLPSLLAQAETSEENTGVIQKVMEFFQDFRKKILGIQKSTFS